MATHVAGTITTLAPILTPAQALILHPSFRGYSDPEIRQGLLSLSLSSIIIYIHPAPNTIGGGDAIVSEVMILGENCNRLHLFI